MRQRKWRKTVSILTWWVGRVHWDIWGQIPCEQLNIRMWSLEINMGVKAISKWQLQQWKKMKSSRKYRMESIYFYLDIHIFFSDTLLLENLCSLSSFITRLFHCYITTMATNIHESNGIVCQKRLNIGIRYVSTLVIGISQLCYHSSFLASLPSSSLPYNSYCQIFLIPFLHILFLCSKPFRGAPFITTAKLSPTLNFHHFSTLFSTLQGPSVSLEPPGFIPSLVRAVPLICNFLFSAYPNPIEHFKHYFSTFWPFPFDKANSKPILNLFHPCLLPLERLEKFSACFLSLLCN